MRAGLGDGVGRLNVGRDALRVVGAMEKLRCPDEEGGATTRLDCDRDPVRLRLLKVCDCVLNCVEREV